MTTRYEAEALADEIRAYWQAQGHWVKTRVVRTHVGAAEIYSVRSDMVDGLPRTAKTKRWQREAALRELARLGQQWDREPERPAFVAQAFSRLGLGEQ